MEEGGRIVAHITDSPKPPPARVTLTLPAVNAATCCVFAACGAGKADMMARLLAKEKEGLPAVLDQHSLSCQSKNLLKKIEQRVWKSQIMRFRSGNLHWILDEA